MSEARNMLGDLSDEAGAARAHFHTWWALRNLALPDFYEAMNDYTYVDFFHTSNAGNYKLFFLTLSKIFDRDPRVSGISHLKEALRQEGYQQLASELEARLIPLTSSVARVMNIRSKTIVHNDRTLSREKVYEINGITPDEIKALIDSTCELLNMVARGLGITNVISEGARFEKATLAMLERLRDGET
jgi:hypothetical protein